jgi:hypothetical protein
MTARKLCVIREENVSAQLKEEAMAGFPGRHAGIVTLCRTLPLVVNLGTMP